jgi:maleylacetate reductase
MTVAGRVTFSAMEEVVFGRPAADAVAEQADRIGAKRVFLMASGTLDRTTGEIEAVRHALGARHVGTFNAMPAHSPRSAVIKAAEQARAAGADLIATYGGGSVTDAAKAVQLCLANDIRTPDAMDALRVVGGVMPNIKPPVVRQISVPTTLSAGEFSALAGVTDERTKTKELFRHPLLMPRATILDPAATVHTPEWLFLSTGIRAVDHCVEGLCSLESNPYGDAQALKGLALLAHAMPRVRANPADLAARLDCQIGMWLSMGPLSSGVPMGASHGIGYILGALFDVPHGYTSCVMLPAVMRWNKPANAERQALVATAMGQPGQDAGDVLDGFIRGLGLPRTLRDVKILPEQFGRVAEGAMFTPWVPRNPRPIAGPVDVRAILDLAA